jgi:hypothetical protein
VLEPLVSSSISHEPATLWTKVPMAEKIDADHRARKRAMRSGEVIGGVLILSAPYDRGSA